MNVNKRSILGAGLIAVTALTASAVVLTATRTFRTTGYFIGVSQGSDTVTGHPQFDEVTLIGRNLVNLAMGRAITDTNFGNQVMAMTFACDLSSASLVVYDLSSSNTLATIASSTNLDVVRQQDGQQPAPNRARFVTQLAVVSGGNSSNGLAGGYLTVAGRVRLNPVTGCPEAVLVRLDRDSLDSKVGDRDIPAKLDPDPVKLTERAGLAHLIGVIHTVTDGSTNTVLIPHGALSIRRFLPAAGPLL